MNEKKKMKVFSNRYENQLKKKNNEYGGVE